jgi:excinuclease ABC subunit A
VATAEIRIEGARAHNLKGVSCSIPVGALTVISGPSGSGKSSLAFDTLYAEGQRRYVASLSTYARQFLEKLPRPAVDLITNLPPAIAIEQRNRVTNARSTIGTATEILDHLRLLFAKAGETRCCGRAVEPGTVDAIAGRMLRELAGERVVLAVALAAKAKPKELREQLLREGLRRLLLAGGAFADLDDISATKLGALRGEALLVIDRLEVAAEQRTRLAEAIATGFLRGGGELVVAPVGGARRTYREGFCCDVCGRRHPAPEPALFSFNSPLGACPACHGFGRTQALDLARVIPDPARTLAKNAIAPFATPSARSCQRDLINACRDRGLATDVAWGELSDADRDWVIRGDDAWYGVKGYFEWLESRRYKVQARVAIARYRRFDPCESCGGSRLRSEALAVELAGRTIGDAARLTIGELGAWLARLDLSGEREARGKRVLDALRARVETALRVGLDYLALDRQVRTLSGGEAQRIQLATALGGALTAALYVLDEPSVGLHPRDVNRLLEVLRGIRDAGNTVVVVEHALEIAGAADLLIDMGPGSGRRGGEIVASGSVADITANPASLTGRALSGAFTVKRTRRTRASGRLRIRGARAHNLHGVDVTIPLGQLVVVTGVSGAGKTSLVRSVLVGNLERSPERGQCDAIEGAERIREVAIVEPTPPGRSLRSNLATVSKAYDGIRARFASMHEAKRRGLTPGYFSFNIAGGRCEACEGAGEVVVDMQFLEEVRTPCEACDGTRFRKEAREISVGGRSIVDVLALTLDEAREAFAGDASVASRLEPFARVGLGYLTLEQPLSTLSGGELQRIRVAQALTGRAQSCLFVLDEPTTGLHAAEVQVLLDCLDQLLDDGASLVVVEHNLDVIRLADHLIDLGPEGGPGGGRLVAEGTPEEVARVAESFTGAALRAAGL